VTQYRPKLPLIIIYFLVLFILSKILFLEEIRQANILVEQGKKKIKKKKNYVYILNTIFHLLILLKIFYKKQLIKLNVNKIKRVLYNYSKKRIINSIFLFIKNFY
jgi:di/tricarboxylate transporter